MGSHKQVSALNIEGRFLGFVGEDGDRPKRLRLATSEGEYSIKLKLANMSEVSVYSLLAPGDWVRVFGEKKLNLKTGEVKLKAYLVMPAPASTCDLPTSVVVATPPPPQTLLPALIPVTPAKPKATILVCQKSDCRKKGGPAVCQALAAALSDRGLEDQVAIKETGCMKQCKAGPNIIVMPNKTRYSRIDPEEIPQIIEKHFATETTPEKLSPQGDCCPVLASTI